MNITISNIQKVFLTENDVRNVKLFIMALESYEIPYEVHYNGKIEVLFLDNPLVEDITEKLEAILKKHVISFSEVIWRTSPLNCKISIIKEIFIRDLENSLTISANDFEQQLKASNLKYRFCNKTFGLYLKKPNFKYNLEQYTSDFENILKHVKTIDTINWYLQ